VKATYSALCTDTCPPELEPVMKPRNLKQVNNCQTATSKQKAMAHDAMYHVHELAYELAPFVRSIRTYPDLLVIFAHQSVVDEVELLLNSYPVHVAQTLPLLSYDTTFNLGDLSLLTIKHVLLQTQPVIPMAGVIHIILESCLLCNWELFWLSTRIWK